MKKILKIFLILVVLSWISYGSYFIYKNYFAKSTWKNTEDVNKFNENLSVEVSKQDMISSLNFIWNTKIKNEQKLKFNSDSTVVAVHKKAWELVKKWELIAEIDKKSVLSQIEILKINLENAKLKLKKIKENNTDVDIKKAKNELQSLKDDYKNKEDNIVFFKKEEENKIKDLEKSLTQKNLEYKLLEKELWNNINQINISPKEKLQSLEESKNKLKIQEDEYKRDSDNFSINLEKKQNEYYNSIEKEYLDIKNSISSLNKTFTELDKLLSFKPTRNSTNNYYYFFSAKNSTFKNEATNSSSKAYANYLNLSDKFDKLKDKYDIDWIISLIEIQKEMYENLSTAWDNVIKWLDNSIESEDFSDSVISNYYSVWTSLFSESNSKINTLKDIPANLKTLKSPDDIKKDLQNDLVSKNDSINSLKLSIKKAEDDYTYDISTIDEKVTQEKDKLTDKKKEIDDLVLNLDKTKKNNSYDINAKYKELDNSKISITESEKKLKDLLDTSNNQEISLAENDVKQSEISLQNEVAKLDTYELKAPFDWVITKNEYMVWDNLTSDDQKNVLIENPDILEISIFADQVDITKLSKWQKAIITYDSFPWKEFSWEIVDIDSTPQDKDGVTKYEVKVFMTKWEERIFSWMNANVNIVIQQKLWVLAIPFSAIKTDEKTWEEYVTVLWKSLKKEKRKVKSWYSDWVNTEILEGLKEWEKVLEIDYDSNYYKPEDFESTWWWMWVG
jgi:hypothetical protein